MEFFLRLGNVSFCEKVCESKEERWMRLKRRRRKRKRERERKVRDGSGDGVGRCGKRAKGRVLYGGGARHKPGRQVGPFATRGRPKVAVARTSSPMDQHDKRSKLYAKATRPTEMPWLQSNMVASPHAKKLEDLRRRTRTQTQKEFECSSSSSSSSFASQFLSPTGDLFLSDYFVAYPNWREKFYLLE